MLRPIALAATTALVASCAAAPRAAIPVLARASLVAADGTPAGTATITAPRGGAPVLVLTVSNIPLGAHGLHLHAVGKCEAPGFTTAGGHLNPTGHEHGTLNPRGSHLGDVPNLTVGGDGLGTLEHRFRVSAAELHASLFDADGSAIVIHAGADDYRSDPAGNSGGRIACGVLTRG